MHAETSGVLASGSPVRSAGGALKQTYALFDERVPRQSGPADGATAALAELVRRYFASRGPATNRDCAGWSGLTLADIRPGLRLVRDSRPGRWRGRIDGVGLPFRRESVTAAAGEPPGST